MLPENLSGILYVTDTEIHFQNKGARRRFLLGWKPVLILNSNFRQVKITNNFTEETELIEILHAIAISDLPNVQLGCLHATYRT